jgi:ATP-dependent Clp protease ATP-binding subunit ClpA
MYQQFTDSARKSMTVANTHAEQFKHNYVGCLHILLAVVDVAPGAFQATSVDVVPLRASAVSRLAHSSSEGGKAAIESSFEQARLHGSATVDVKHLVMGLLASPDHATRSVFDELQLDMPHVYRQLADGLSAQ